MIFDGCCFVTLCLCWQQSSIIVFNNCMQAGTEEGLGELRVINKRWYILLRKRNNQNDVIVLFGGMPAMKLEWKRGPSRGIKEAFLT